MAVTSKQHPIVDLNNEALAQINGSTIKPTYDRSQLQAGIVHIGVGNFHRAHLSWYLHRLMQKGMDLDWAIIGSGVTEYDISMREKLANQDYLTTLIELDPKGNQSSEIVGPMIDYVAIEKNNQSLIQAMSKPNIRIVSLTVTESRQSGAGVDLHQSIHPHQGELSSGDGPARRSNRGSQSPGHPARSW